MDGVKMEQVIARAVSELRHQKGWTQSDLAHWVSSTGVEWSANRVAQIETLRGKVTLYELVALTWVFEVPLDRLLAGDDWVQFPNGTSYVPLINIRSWLATGHPSPDAVPPGGWPGGKKPEPPEEVVGVEVRARAATASASGVAHDATVRVVEGAAKADLGGLKAEASGIVLKSNDSEEIRKIAKRLEIPPTVLNFLARKLWGHAFTVERDIRAPIFAGMTKRSAQTRRGHATRALIAEVSDYIERTGMEQVTADYDADQAARRAALLSQMERFPQLDEASKALDARVKLAIKELSANPGVVAMSEQFNRSLRELAERVLAPGLEHQRRMEEMLKRASEAAAPQAFAAMAGVEPNIRKYLKRHTLEELTQDEEFKRLSDEEQATFIDFYKEMTEVAEAVGTAEPTDDGEQENPLDDGAGEASGEEAAGEEEAADAEE